MLERRHGTHDAAHNSLQIAIADNTPGGEVYDVILCKEPGDDHFKIEEMFRGNCNLQKASSDFMCLEW